METILCTPEVQVAACEVQAACEALNALDMTPSDAHVRRALVAHAGRLCELVRGGQLTSRFQEECYASDVEDLLFREGSVHEASMVAVERAVFHIAHGNPAEARRALQGKEENYLL